MDNFTTDPVSNLLHTQENLLSYRPGGFHPVCLGDKFKDGQYEVVHKLGWGGFSTVWLARDTQAEIWVALKICQARASTCRQELSMLQSLRGNTYTVNLHDDFIHEGPNGSHLCIVTEFLGPSLSSVIEDYRPESLDPEDILRLTRRILQATASLHEAKIAHGDISGSNIVFTTSKIVSLSKNELFEIVGEPETAALLNVDGSLLNRGLPKQLVKNMEWENWIDEDEEDIRFVDLGGSFKFESVPSALAQPSELRVPETFFVDKFSHEVDLWRVGCVIYSTLFASYPFYYLGEDDVFISQMISFVEDLPPEWKEKWRQRLDKSRRQLSSTSPESQLVQRFARRVQATELAPLLPIIQGLMKFRPAERISARYALQLLNDGDAQI